MIVDTSALLAYFDSAEPDHQDVARVIDGSDELLVVSPYVVAEVDCLVAARAGVDAETAVLRELCGGAWELADFGGSELRKAVGIVEKYRDQRIGVAAASIVVLAERYRTRKVATLDRRHFTVLRTADSGRFDVVP